MAFTCCLHATFRLRNPEIENARDAINTHHNVLWGHVAMHETQKFTALVTRFVRGMEPRQDLGDHRKRNFWRRELFRLALKTKQTCERFTLHVVHNKEQFAIEGNDIECGHHIGVPNARRKTRLVHEHRHKVRILRVLRVKPLDCNRTRKSNRSKQAPQVDRRHAAMREFCVQSVPTNDARHRRDG